MDVYDEYNIKRIGLMKADPEQTLFLFAKSRNHIKDSPSFILFQFSLSLSFASLFYPITAHSSHLIIYIFKFYTLGLNFSDRFSYLHHGFIRAYLSHIPGFSINGFGKSFKIPSDVKAPNHHIFIFSETEVKGRLIRAVQLLNDSRWPIRQYP